MERLAGWLWRRARRRFIVIMMGATFLLVFVGVLAPVLTLYALYYDFTLIDVLAFGSVIGTVVLVSFGTGVVQMRAVSRPGIAWCNGDSSDPTGALRCGLLWPQMVVQRGLAFCVVGHAALTLPFARFYLGLSWAGITAFSFNLAVANAVGLVMGALALTLLLRPMVEEVHDHLAGRPELPTGGWSLRARLYGVFAAGTILVGEGNSAIASRFELGDARLIAATVMAVVLTSYVINLFAFGLVEPLLSPLGDLTRATRRVGRGSLDERAPVTSVDELGDLVVAFNEMQQGLRERATLHAAFGSYVDPGLAQRLLESGSSMFDGEDLEVSVMFADVRSFTEYAEGVSPAEAVQLLNRLFDVMVPVIHEHGGHANHYLGDGLLAVFGAPQTLEQHADAAVAAAVEIQRQVRTALGDELRLGIGINTGPVIAGTVVGGGRLKSTVIGDTVNAAARVEALTKETGDAILMTDATRLALSTPRPRSIRRGEFEVRGKATRLTLHAINPFPRTTR